MSLTQPTAQDLEQELAKIESDLQELDKKRVELSSRQEAIRNYFAALALVAPDSRASSLAAKDDPEVVRVNVFGQKKRIRSTDFLASVVIGSGRKWTREQLHKGFDAKYGIPEGWENPEQAINNAIGRAVKRGTIHEANALYFE